MSDEARRPRRSAEGWWRRRAVGLIGVALGCAAPGVVAQDRGLTATRVDAAPAVDGILDDEVWDRADFATGFVQREPDEGSRASQETRVRLLTDGASLFVGARLLDSEAGAIVERMARRDEAVLADWFYVYVDSYHDRRTAFAFGVSAAGVQRDLRISGETREDAGWDAVWASAVTRDGEGWSVEMRIPLSQLRFSTAARDTRWGLNFERRIARRNEVAHWAAVPQGTDRFVSLFGELGGLDGIEPGSSVQLLPYSVARVRREPGVAADPFHSANDPYASVGADLLVGLGSSLTLSATINPDFAQVEADPATVNLTAFETFQQERRPFFVEGSEILAPSFPFWPPFFYSRRIGRSPQGPGAAGAAFQDRPAATTILGAAKLTGKTENGWSIGLLDAVTAQESARFVDAAGTPGQQVVEPRTNYAVARIGRELREGRSGIGVIGTSTNRSLSGTDLDRLHSSAYGFGGDAFHRFGDGAYIANLAVLGSHVRGSAEAIERTQRAPGHYFQRPDADHVELDPTRTSLTGLSATGRVARVEGRLKTGLYAEATSPGYEIADLGFNPSLDYLNTQVWLRWEEFTPGPVFRNWSVGTASMMQKSWNGERRELTQDLGFFFELPSYWGGGVWVMRHADAWTPTALRGGPALRRPGRWMGSFSANSDRRRELGGSANVFWTTEDEGGGYDLNLSSSLTWQASDRLDLRVGPSWSTSHASWQYVGTRDVDGQDLPLVGALDRTTLSASARLDYTFSPHLSLQLYARPFLASGTYRAIREVADPTAERFDTRFRTYGATEATLADGRYSIDRDGDGATDITLPDPSFNLGSLQMNAVLRWEYRPGSTLFAVWTHDRERFGSNSWDLAGDLDRLMSAPSTNVFQLKVSYWIGL